LNLEHLPGADEQNRTPDTKLGAGYNLSNPGGHLGDVGLLSQNVIVLFDNLVKKDAFLADTPMKRNKRETSK
jgi:hypothetical protein